MALSWTKDERTRKGEMTDMLNYLIQSYISHILLIDYESSGTVRSLVGNAFELHAALGKIPMMGRDASDVDSYDKYTLILAFPANRSDLVSLADELTQKSKGVGVEFKINIVSNADMPLFNGKAGLLGCSLWRLAGSVLMNDLPISPEFAELILSVANKSQGVHLIGEGLHAAIVVNRSDFNQKLMHLPEGHGLGEILRAIDAQSSQQDSHSKRKWW